MLRESATFNFGYYLSLHMIVYAVSIIYAPYTPIITLIGMIYFYLRMLFDSHLLLNVYKNELDSGGKLFHISKKRLIYLLMVV